MHRHVLRLSTSLCRTSWLSITQHSSSCPLAAWLWCLAAIFGKFCLLCPATLGELSSLQLWTVPAYGNMCVYSSCTPTCACRSCWLRVGRMHRQMPHDSRHLLITCNVWGKAQSACIPLLVKTPFLILMTCAAMALLWQIWLKKCMALCHLLLSMLQDLHTSLSMQFLHLWTKMWMHSINSSMTNMHSQSTMARSHNTACITAPILWCMWGATWHLPHWVLEHTQFFGHTTPWTALAGRLSHHIITQHDQRPG